MPVEGQPVEGLSVQAQGERIKMQGQPVEGERFKAEDVMVKLVQDTPVECLLTSNDIKMRQAEQARSAHTGQDDKARVGQSRRL